MEASHRVGSVGEGCTPPEPRPLQRRSSAQEPSSSCPDSWGRGRREAPRPEPPTSRSGGGHAHGEGRSTCEEQLEAAGGEALSNADKRKFAEEQYERALKETEAQGEARRKSVADAVALCAATVAPPDAEDVLVKWTGLGYDEASRAKVV